MIFKHFKTGAGFPFVAGAILFSAGIITIGLADESRN